MYLREFPFNGAKFREGIIQTVLIYHTLHVQFTANYWPKRDKKISVLSLDMTGQLLCAGYTGVGRGWCVDLFGKMLPEFISRQNTFLFVDQSKSGITWNLN